MQVLCGMYAVKLRVPGLRVRRSKTQVVQAVGEAIGEKALNACVLQCSHVRLVQDYEPRVPNPSLGRGTPHMP